MRRQWILALALLLPIAGLAAGVLRNEMMLAAAESWVIPVEGYDPRDLLRGHYIRFRYQWKVEGEESLCDAGACLLCLSRDGNEVTAHVHPRDAAPRCDSLVDPKASNIGPRFTARIFVSEASAPQLDAALRAGPMAVEALLRRDGILVNRRLLPPQ